MKSEGSKKSRLERLKEVTQDLTNKLEPARAALEGFDKGLSHLPTLASFVAGFYHIPDDHPLHHKMLHGLRAVVAFKVMQSPNLPASFFGTAMTAEIWLKLLGKIGQQPVIGLEEQIKRVGFPGEYVGYGEYIGYEFGLFEPIEPGDPGYSSPGSVG